MQNYFYVSTSGDGWQNLATDEWLLDHIEDDELILYLYVNRGCVVVGKNQNPWQECDLNAMERDDVQLVRRITGGGAVFHDKGNLNFSFVAGKDRYDTDKQFGMILNAIRLLDIPCEFSGRNDLLSEGRKFSGNAFCSRGNGRQHHGTLLVSADLGRLQNYLHVDPRKLQAKGVSSVRSRVCNLSDIREDLTVPMLIGALKQALRKTYGDYTDWSPSPAVQAEIEVYRQRHSSWEWRLGKTPQFDIQLDQRFPWGGVQLQLQLSEGRVTNADVYSDAMDAELPPLIKGLLEGQKFSSQAMADALRFSENQQLRDVADWLENEHL